MFCKVLGCSEYKFTIRKVKSYYKTLLYNSELNVFFTTRIINLIDFVILDLKNVIFFASIVRSPVAFTVARVFTSDLPRKRHRPIFVISLHHGQRQFHTIVVAISFFPWFIKMEIQDALLLRAIDICYRRSVSHSIASRAVSYYDQYSIIKTRRYLKYLCSSLLDLFKSGFYSLSNRISTQNSFHIDNSKKKRNNQY